MYCAQCGYEIKLPLPDNCPDCDIPIGTPQERKDLAVYALRNKRTGLYLMDKDHPNMIKVFARTDLVLRELIGNKELHDQFFHTNELGMVNLSMPNNNIPNSFFLYHGE